ncbi:urease accessory protein UreE [Bacillus sp. FJAT-44742]|uniref:urease accessory protein UreE n=1 Tax=Bacillus sp. FJAT-44742 TaxID=2014005 RepID=UPI000C24FD71|nr:urease accessory protein UreE [Bacillus sp. FJAT-44742]
MYVQKTLGNISEKDSGGKSQEWLELDWEELSKRIIRKKTSEGRDIAIALEEGENLQVGDILYEDEQVQVVVRTSLEKVYVVTPQTMIEMGKAAFELGNRHTPCIIEDNEIVVRYDSTLPVLFEDAGVNYREEERRFQKPFKYKGHSH